MKITEKRSGSIKIGSEEMVKRLAAGKCKYVFMFREQNIQTANKSLQMGQSANTSERHLTNHNCMNEEIKSRLSSKGTESCAFPFAIIHIKI